MSDIPGPIRVLLIDDDEEDFMILRDYLLEIKTQNFEIDWAPDYQSGRALAQQQSHHVFLIDYRLGPHNGLDLLRELLAAKIAAPMILLTGLGDHAVDQAAMKAGADDYLVKGQISANILERSIRHALLRKETEQKLRASEERLRQAQKMEALGNLAGGIAHDFNNILAIIQAYSERLKTPGLPPAQTARYVEALEKAVARGAGLVRQILAFARKAEPNFSYVEVNEVIGEITSMISQTFPRNIVITCDLAAHLPLIYADSAQFHQVLLNLCVNARDAMPSGGALTISTALLDPAEVRERFPDVGGTPYVRINVRDNGLGIEESVQARIFEPFFSTKSPERGTGLGLATVYGIMKSHKGAIEVKSTPGAGACFSVFFPAPPAKSAQDQNPSTAVHGSKGTETIPAIHDEKSDHPLAAREDFPPLPLGDRT